MTDIDTILAGKELDALIAEKVFGWKNLVWKEGGHRLGESGYYVSWPTGWYGDGPDRANYLTKSYSTNMGDAWEVVAQLASKYRVSLTDLSADGKLWQCSLEARDGRLRWLVELAHKGDVFSDSETPALAVCRSALKAIMGEGDGL